MFKVVSKGMFKGVSRKFFVLTRKFQLCLHDVSKLFQGIFSLPLGLFKGVSSVSQGYPNVFKRKRKFKNVTSKFHVFSGKFKGLAKVFKR